MSYILGSGSKLYLQLLQHDGGAVSNGALELPFVSESLNPSAEFINANNMSLGRSTGIGKKGNAVADGSFETEISAQNIIFLLTGALGYLDTGNTKITPHASTLPVFDAYVYHGSGSDMTIKFAGVQFNNFSMDLVSNAVLTASVDLVGLDYTDGATVPVSPSIIDLLTTNLAYPDALTSFTINSEDVLDDVTSFSFAINNNISTDLVKLDGSGRIALVPGELAITGSFEAIIASGDPLGLKTADVGTSLGNIVIDLDLVDTVTFTFKNVYITNITHDINDRGVLKVSVDFQAFKGSDGSNPLEVTYAGTTTLTIPTV